MKVWIDGKVVEGGSSEARIPVTDHGLLYGDGVFEGLRIYGGRVFRMPDHLERIGTAARAIGLSSPGGARAVPGRSSGRFSRPRGRTRVTRPMCGSS